MSDILRKWLIRVDIDPKTVRIETVEFIPERPGWFTYTTSNNDTAVCQVDEESIRSLYLDLLEGMF